MEDKRLWELAKKYGTPLYIFDADLIKKTYTMMKKELKDFEIFFSVKANPSLAICQVLKESGSSIEVASEGELRLALERV